MDVRVVTGGPVTSVYRLGGRVARSLGGGDGSGGGPPSRVVGLSLQRAGAGLIAAACVQVTVCVIVTRSGTRPCSSR
ncbi:MAG TPA: hypothetical protein VHZ03_20195 [Trebonia sp.]|nr:hypothetical protein [Trebonia sp.]